VLYGIIDSLAQHVVLDFYFRIPSFPQSEFQAVGRQSNNNNPINWAQFAFRQQMPLHNYPRMPLQKTVQFPGQARKRDYAFAGFGILSSNLFPFGKRFFVNPFQFQFFGQKPCNRGFSHSRRSGYNHAHTSTKTPKLLKENSLLQKPGEKVRRGSCGTSSIHFSTTKTLEKREVEEGSSGFRLGAISSQLFA
jgi:hypothetical protein